MAAKIQVRLLLFFFFFCVSYSSGLRFSKNGEFKILQVADMHYGDGFSSCKDVLPTQKDGCSDLNTTAFLRRMIRAENPDLIAFTGDNIYGWDTSDPVESLKAAFAPAVESKIPWVAILGNHDQESRSLTREGVMKYIVTMEHTLSQLNPVDVHNIDGFGNYNIEVGGVEGSSLVNKSVLNLYFLDSGDYSKAPFVPGYGWIQPSQKSWFEQTSRKLQESYMNKPEPQKNPAPGLVYFHIPLRETASFDSSNIIGVKQERTACAMKNSGFFETMMGTGDVKAVFNGHDHVNDFCGELTGIQLCYAGGFGYHAYGKTGWDRRSRVVLVSLETTENGGWGGVQSIRTWKQLDDEHLTTIDSQVLWSKSSVIADH